MENVLAKGEKNIYARWRIAMQEICTLTNTNKEKRFWREICVKNYELLELEVVLLQQSDVITASADDNVGGIPGGWGENE